MHCDKKRETNKPFILTTGGKGGIGSVVLQKLLEAGYAPIDLDLYTGKCCPCGYEKHFCDLTREENIKAVAAELEGKEVRLVGLIHMAGMPGKTVGLPFTRIDPEDFDRCFALHNKAFFLLLKYFSPFFEPKGASVVALSSIAAVKNGESLLPYAASKAALNTMVQCFARELAPMIRVNAVAPGFVWTPLWEDLAALYLGENPKNLSGRELFDTVVERKSLLKKAQEAEDIASQILFLLGEQSRAITGQILYVDGGASVV